MGKIDSKAVNHLYPMNDTTKLCYTSVLAALCLVANIFSINLFANNFLSFVYFFTLIAAIYLGSVLGGCIGFVTDVLGWAILPQGTWNPLLSVSCLFMGVIPGLIFKYVKTYDLLKVILSMTVCFVFCSCFLNTLGLWLTYHYIPFANGTNAVLKKTFWVYLVGRLPILTINIVANSILVYAVVKTKVLDKMIIRSASLTEK